MAVQPRALLNSNDDVGDDGGRIRKGEAVAYAITLLAPVRKWSWWSWWCAGAGGVVVLVVVVAVVVAVCECRGGGGRFAGGGTEATRRVLVSKGGARMEGGGLAGQRQQVHFP